MSSRVIKAKLAPKVTIPQSHEENDNEPERTQNYDNPFELLNYTLSEESSVEKVQEITSSLPEHPEPKQSYGSKRNKKRRKKKTSQNVLKSSDEKKELSNDNTDLNVLAKELTIEDSTNRILKSTEISLLKIDPTALDPITELRRLFGSEVIHAVKESKESKSYRRVVHRHRKTHLVKPKETWPKMESGLNMELIEVKNGVNYFKIVWSQSYKELQKVFFQCVNSGDPHTFIDLILLKHPYHIDSLLQLAEAFTIMKEYDTAADFIERILYAFECSWHQQFKPLNEPIHRLEYRHPENRAILIAIFRHIQDLGRRGCSRTALEFCKFLLSLDLHDPLYILLAIDHYALRCKELDFLIELSYSDLFSERDLNSLPNFAFSLALAKFYIEKGMCSKKTKTNTKSSVTESPKRKLLSSSELLQNALMLFPMVFVPLLKKMSIHSFDIKDSEGNVCDLMLHAYFVDVKCPPTLHSLVTLFVERNYTLWKDPNVLSWLKENAAVVAKRAETKDPMITNCETILEEFYKEAQFEESLVRHILLSECPDAVTTLPIDLVREGIRIYDDSTSPTNTNSQTMNSTHRNLLTLFLQSLLPFDISALGSDSNQNNENETSTNFNINDSEE